MDFLRACLDASKKIIDLFNRNSDLFEYISKGYGGDRSMKIDLIAEEIFIKNLSSFGNIFSEECGYIDKNLKTDVIIDPIDGSFNISNGMPYYGSSVALKENEKIIKAFVINLATGDYFYRDENNLIEKNLYHKTIFHKFHDDLVVFERAYSNPDVCNILHSLNIKFRSPGALALSLATAKRYKAVVFFGKIREFDIAAGMYISKDLYQFMDNDFILISKDKEFFEKLLNILKDR